MRASHDWFCFSLVEKVARDLLTNHREKQESKAEPNQTRITFALQQKLNICTLHTFVVLCLFLKIAFESTETARHVLLIHVQNVLVSLKIVLTEE